MLRGGDHRALLPAAGLHGDGLPKSKKERSDQHRRGRPTQVHSSRETQPSCAATGTVPRLRGLSAFMFRPFVTNCGFNLPS